MGQWYWTSEYIKLFAAYAFVIYIWPQVVFENHLKGKSLSYRFSFCTIFTVLLVNAMVLMLGLIHCLRPWVTTVIFLGVFFWRLFTNHTPFRMLWHDVQSLHRETMSRRRLLLRAAGRVKEALKAWYAPVSERLRGRRLEYGLLMIALIFGTLYFSWGALTEHIFGCGDQYVHHQWTYGLEDGKIFYAGIYPEAMHCMIYLTCSLFRIPLYNGILFFGGIYVHVFLISIWLFMKEVFHWRYTPLAALAMFLCYDQISLSGITSMARLSWTLPMEYALFSAFLSGVFLLRFLKRVLRGGRVKLHPLKPRQWGILHDDDLLLFTGAVAVSLAVHFYITIVAFFLCAVIALVYIRQVFRPGSFLPLAASVLLALFISSAPMAAAFAAGYPLQDSLYWAMGVMETDYSGGRQESSEEEQVSADETADTGAQETDTGETDEEGTYQDGGTAEMQMPRRSLADVLREKATILYWASYYAMYPGRRVRFIMIATVFALIVSLAAHIVLAVHDLKAGRAAKKGEEPQKLRDRYDGILITALISVVYMIMFNAALLGVPQLIEGGRVCSIEHVLIIMLLAFPIDCLMLPLSGALGQRVMKGFAVALFIGVYITARAAGIFHSYLYIQLTRYEAAAEMTNKIMDTLPPQTYTIVSTTEELYQVIEKGFHEELLEFIQDENDGTYTIPTPYVLLYIEKRPLWYVQIHFHDGAGWLAGKDYPKMFGDTASQCPDVLHSEISEKAADEKIFYGEKLSDSATDREGRTVLESRAYRWYRTFSGMHPRDCRVVYEDDDLMCCCITQNPGSLYTLGIMGGGGK